MRGYGGGMHGCSGVCGWGACVVSVGHAWLWRGGCAWLQGACVVVGGVHGCGGNAWLWGSCMVSGRVCMVSGVCVWLWEACMVGEGGVCGCRGHAWLWGACVAAGACMVAGDVRGCRGCAWLPGECIGYDKIRSMSRRYASYWNAFLFEYGYCCAVI